MDTKLRIDISQGFLEVEGSEAFVREIYGDFKDKISELAQVTQKKTKAPQVSEPEEPPTRKSKARTQRRETLTIVKDLNLAAQDDKPSLKDFYSRYSVSNNFERNLIFVYYLQNFAKVTSITNNHVFTCYRNVNVRIPGAFNQSLWDTGSKKGWIDTGSLDDIKLTTHGINYIEYEITKVG